ncbi:TnsA endonuclease N-terminal domain-containing protein [Paenibacillus sp. FSL R7-0216]|uniref:TnsA endonuclease N-terminal domain-containing protein n=1 Tax=Paenibacillus sp. FSL R7-0216 TaxID=2921677 RepID=UPI0030D95AEB
MSFGTKDRQYQPIVLPRNKRYGNNYWNARGPKVGYRDVILYSDLEFDHWLQTETDWRVSTYCEQPLEITYVCNEKRFTSIFDMWTLSKHGKITFIEVKYEAELNPKHSKYERTMRQIEAQREWCKQEGVHHEVRTEKQIRPNRFRNQNQLKILSTISNEKKPDHLEQILDKITVRTSISKLADELSSKFTSLEIQLACHWLYYEGKIDANLDMQIWSNEMEVWRNEQT